MHTLMKTILSLLVVAVMMVLTPAGYAAEAKPVPADFKALEWLLGEWHGEYTYTYTIDGEKSVHTGKCLSTKKLSENGKSIIGYDREENPWEQGKWIEMDIELKYDSTRNIYKAWMSGSLGNVEFFKIKAKGNELEVFLLDQGEGAEFSNRVKFDGTNKFEEKGQASFANGTIVSWVKTYNKK